MNFQQFCINMLETCLQQKLLNIYIYCNDVTYTVPKLSLDTQILLERIISNQYQQNFNKPKQSY